MIPVTSRSITFSSHASQALKVMDELRRCEELCDVVLCVDGERWPAHRIVLAGCSPYLRAMFTNGMQETGQKVVTLHDIDADLLSALLDFMYRGEITINTNNVQVLLQGASLLHLANLRAACCNFLQLHLDASNCLGIQAFADIYSCVELENSASQFVYQHFMDVVQHEEFLNLPETDVLNLLSSDRIQVIDETQVFEAALLWINCNFTDRLDSSCSILRHVKMPLLDLSYLENIVLQTEFVQNCPKCQNLVANAIRVKSDNNALALISSRSQPQGIFTVGGRNSTDSQLKTMERYDFVRDHWVPMGTMRAARTAMGAASINNLILAVGGECALADSQEETKYLRSVEAYDPRHKDWHWLADMKVARSFLSVCVVGDHLYALGGEDRAATFNIVERYDYRTNSWCFQPSMHRKRAGAGVAVCDGKIYIAGGYDKNFHTDRASVECYDPDTQLWSFVAEMEKARSGLCLVAVDHHLYALGGRSRHNDMYYETVERYNTWTMQWSSAAPMNTPRAWPSVAVIDHKIYVMGGFDGTNRLRSVEMFDPEYNTWSYVCQMTTSRAGAGAAVL